MRSIETDSKIRRATYRWGGCDSLMCSTLFYTKAYGEVERETAATWSWSIIRRANIPHRISFGYTHSSSYHLPSFCLLIPWFCLERKRSYTSGEEGDRASLNVKRIRQDMCFSLSFPSSVFAYMNGDALFFFSMGYWKAFLVFKFTAVTP